MLDLSIGIVTYNNEDKILNVLGDLFTRLENLSFAVYVFDNNSQDRTVEVIKEQYPQVKLISNTVNAGFGHGHNCIINKVSSRYHLILNPDIRLKDKAIEILVNYLDEHSDVAMVTPRVMNPDGTEQYLPKLTPTFKYLLSGRLQKFSAGFADIRREYTMADLDSEDPIAIQFCTGCFMLCRTDILQKINGFDERFFMYMEDAELSQRVARHGKIIFYPAVAVVHEWERSSAKSLKYFLIHVQSMLKFLRLQSKENK